MASTLQLDSFRPAGRKAASMPLLSPGADLGAGGVIVLHVEQAGGGGAYAATPWAWASAASCSAWSTVRAGIGRQGDE